MKPSVILYAFLLAGLACQRPKVISVPPSVEFTGQPATSTALDSISEEDTFYVSIEVVVHAGQMQQYPLTDAAVRNALAEWTKHLPVRLSLYTEDPTPSMYWPFGPPSYLDRWNIVEILMDDLQAPPYNYPTGLLGIWDPFAKQVLLDADLLENNPELAYSVALHELGHMFGLPHLVDMATPATSGWIIVPPGEDATSYVMYPRYVSGHGQNVLSQLEIDIARHHLLYWWTNPSDEYKNERCHLTMGPSRARTRCGGTYD